MKKGKKSNLKKLFCIVLTMAMVMTTLPLGRERVFASNMEPKLKWISNIADASNCMQVEEGKCFYLGDYIYRKEVLGYDTYPLTASMLKEAAYSSSDESVASVDAQTGYVETKKEGIAILTFTYNGKKKTCKLEVKLAGSLTKGLKINVKKKMKKLEKQLGKVLSVMEEEVTLSNAYDMLEEYLNYFSLINNEPFWDVITDNGFLMSENKLIVPLAGREHTLYCMLQQYEYYDLPKNLFGEDGGTYQGLPVASISATPKKITIKAEEKITAEQILAMQMKALFPEDLIGRNKAKDTDSCGVMILDVKTHEVYCGICVFTEGSRLIQCEIYKNGYKYGFPLKSGKLKKGHTYRVGSKKSEWPRGIRVTVK